MGQISNVESFRSAFLDKITHGLPGAEAQFAMAPAIRKEFDYSVIDFSTVSHASVLILFYQNDSGIYFPLIQRAEDNTVHSKQISLPGGHYETADSNEINTATRECEEEIGVDASQIEVIGRLTTLYIPPSNFLVTPVVGMIRNTPVFKRNPSEVEGIIEVPLNDLFDDSIIKTTSFTIKNYHLKDVPYFNFANNVVWGATAMVLNELKVLLKR